MASPLGWFRRHQKGMMVVFGMVLMGIFGLGSVAMMINPGQITNPAANKVVVTWDGGKLQQSQIDNLRIRHFAAARFIEGVEAEARNQKAGNFRSPALPVRWISESADVRQIDKEIAKRYIMAERAKRAGIVVNDAMVHDYISLIHNLVDFSQADLEVINNRVNGDYDDLVDIRGQLKIELAAQQYQIMLNTGLPDALSPTETAEFYNRLEKTIECSVLALDVEDYLDKVSEPPSNSELKKIFEEGRYKIEDPNGLEPGFKRAKRVRINYVSADYVDFLEMEKAKITDQQVQEEYARRVEKEDRLVMELVPQENAGDNGAPTPPGDGGNADDDAAPLPPGDDDADLESGQSGEPEGAGESNGNSADDETETETEQIENGDEEETEQTENGNEEQTEDEGGMPLTLSRTQTQFVSTVQDEDSEAGLNQEETENSDGEESIANQDSEAQPNTDGEDPASTQDELDQPQMLDEEQGEGEQLPDDVVLPGEGSGSLRDPLELRPKKLDAVLSNLIRESMVADVALQEMQQMISEAKDEVREQQYNYADWAGLSDEEKKNSEPEITLNLKELADRFHLRSGETELMNYDDLLEDPKFGARKVIIEIPQRFGGPPRRSSVPLGAIVFSDLDNKSPFDPGDPVVEFGTQTNMLWWPVEIKEVEVLSFSDAKDDVLRFWKLQKARELALADANRIAQDLMNIKAKLLSYSDKAVLTGSFTWYLSGLVKPQGVTTPGDEFMSTAFGLKLNECGGALNDAGDFAYVIQKVFEDSRTDEQIASELLDTWTKFQMVPPNVTGTASGENRNMREGIRPTILEEMNVEWVFE